MKPSRSNRRPMRLTPLAACVALTLATSSVTHNVAFARADTLVTSVFARAPRAASGSARHELATTYEVTSCADDGSPGTLRYVVNHAADGDTADLSHLSCSVITLTTGAIVIPQNNFVLSSDNPITIDGQGTSRVIEHFGTGILGLVRLNLTNGYTAYNSVGGTAAGGCLLSNGSIGMTSTSVSGCTASNSQGQVEGGAIFVQGDLNATASSVVSDSAAIGVTALGGGILGNGSVYLLNSTASGNRALAPYSGPSNSAYGGGIWASNGLRAVHSNISGNTAEVDYHGPAQGGGVFAIGGLYLAYSAVSSNTATSTGSAGGGLSARGNSYVYYSTLDHNQSTNNAALLLAGTSSNAARIGNSTISANTATTGSTAVFTSIPLFLNNSTIAFNIAVGSSAGLYLYPGGTTDLESTIISNNASTAGGGFDVVARDAITGAHNLILSPGATVPGDTITGIDPQLEPLASNFSLNSPLTNALAPNSPAIDRGSNLRNFHYDGRGAFHARVLGISADIGAYEFDGTDTDLIFANGFE